MKRIITICLALLSCFCAFASISTIVSANPQALYSNYPRISLEGENKIKGHTDPQFFETYQDIYYRYFDQDSLFDIGMKLKDDHFSFVVDIDVRQTLNSFYSREYYTNLPFIGNSINAILDMNFPRYAFGEVSLDKFFLSVGRRPISWGAVSHDMAISADVPFLDNIWFDYNTEIKSGKFNYNFIVMSMNSEAIDNSAVTREGFKTVFAHSFAWDFNCFRFSIGELNLIHGEYPNLLDANPFGIYHNLYQDRKSNVMGYLELEGLIGLGNLGALRVYGELVMDDFDLPGEGQNGKPGAFGIAGGLQYHILDGNESITIKENSETYLLRSSNYKFKTGLNLSYEIYYSSTYMYNRDVEEGKFTVPFKMFGSKTLRDKNAYYLGFKYGPNSFYQEINLDYASGKLDAGLGIGILVRGSAYNIDSEYGKDAVISGIVDYDYRYKLYGDKMTTVIINAKAAYLYAPGMQIEGSVNAAFDLYHGKNAVSVSLGNRIDFMGL